MLQQDIDQGTPRSPYFCPIALAMDRNDLEEICVYGSDVSYIDGSMERMGALPEEAMRFLEDFDEQLPVQPFSFELFEEPCDSSLSSLLFDLGTANENKSVPKRH